MAFYVVYILEAHPSDNWQFPTNIRDNVVYASPKDQQERAQLATTCINKLGIQMPALIDDMNDTAERAYTGWPDRLYLIDSQGKIAFKSRPGPYGFKPAELEAALANVR